MTDSNDDLDFEKIIEDFRSNKIEEDSEKDSLAHDLLNNEWIIQKVKQSDAYAQNLYAAMCNRYFIKNEVWPLLTEKKWSCSWRYSGGIISDMLGEGSYTDWYCSGINSDWSDEEFQNATKENQELYIKYKTTHVEEGVVTDEIRQDLLKLGWIVLDE